MKLFQLILTAVIVLVSLGGQFFVKVGLNNTKMQISSQYNVSTLFVIYRIITNPSFLIGFTMMVVSAVLYLSLLYTTEISRALPVMGGMAYLLIFLGAHFFLREAISLWQILGLCFLLLGIVLTAK